MVPLWNSAPHLMAKDTNALFENFISTPLCDLYFMHNSAHAEAVFYGFGIRFIQNKGAFG